MYKARALTPLQPLTSQLWESQCAVPRLPSPLKNKDSQVGSGFLNRTRQTRGDISLLGSMENKFIIASFDICSQRWSLCSGVFVRWLMRVLGTSCVFLGPAALRAGDLPWGLVAVGKVCQRRPTVVLR